MTGLIMNESNSNEKDDLKYKVYLEERRSLVDAEREQSRLFDKAILTLAAGTFGLSLTFIKEIVSNNEPVKIYWLVLAWVFFCASILSTLSSFLTSQRACSRQRDLLEAEYFGGNIGESKVAQPQNNAATCTWWLNVVSIATFMLGVSFLAIFSIINL